MLNIVVPLAGRRPSSKEYRTPESLIPVDGRPMIQWVVESLRPVQRHRFHFVCRAEHLDDSPLVPFLLKTAPGCRIIPVSDPTGGSACTTLLARGWIDSDAPLVVADPWNYANGDLDGRLEEMAARRTDALVLACPESRADWPRALLPPMEESTEARGPIRVPDDSVAWICCFRRGCDFVRAANHMISWDKRVDGQFQATATCNELVQEGARVEIAGVDEDLVRHGFDSPRGALAFKLRRTAA